MRLLRLALLGLSVLLGNVAQAQEPIPSPVLTAEEPPAVSLLTFSTGDVYWERFGHNALMLRADDGSVRIYNWGVFDFEQEDFFLNFARGKMLYQLAVDSLPHTLRAYAREGRWIWEQQLDLSPEQRRSLVAALELNALPHNAEYRYNYFADNCSTRVRDALDRALGGALQQQLQTLPGTTDRFEALRLLSPERTMTIATDLGLGPNSDAAHTAWQAAFIPMNLMASVRQVQLREEGATLPRPLVTREGFLLEIPREAPPALPPKLLWMFLALGVGIALALALLGSLSIAPARWSFASLAFVFELVSGLGGLILLTIWFFTDHTAGWGNHNLLLLNPLCLLLLPACWRKARNRPLGSVLGAVSLVVLISAFGVLGLKLLPIAQQQNWNWIALLLPVHAAVTWGLRKR